MPVASCSNCGARLPKDSRFCPECGVRTSAADDVTAVEEVPPDETGRVPVHKVAAAPHYFGVAPPQALFALAIASLVGAIVLFVAGNALAAALLLATSALFTALFVAASRRLPERWSWRLQRSSPRSRASGSMDSFRKTLKLPGLAGIATNLSTW